MNAKEIAACDVVAGHLPDGPGCSKSHTIGEWRDACWSVIKS
jgi:hypothetical protein